MRPTARGYAAILVAILAIVLGLAFGPRSLNAVAAPLLGAVGFGALQIWRADDPEITVDPIDPGFPGDKRTAEFDIEGGGVVHVRHDWQAGLDGPVIDAVIAAPDTIESAVTLRDRGRYEIATRTVRQRDGLGLVTSAVTVEQSATVLVYPVVHRDAGREAIARMLGGEVLAERQEFDRLREYRPGDPLRDIHWKSSAKRGEFLVTEYEPGDRTEAIMIAGSAWPGHADDMATAAATLALQALESGLSVGLRLPDRMIPPAAGEAHATTLLGALATAAAGELTDAGDAEIRIEARPRVTRATVGDTSVRFADLVDGSPIESTTEVARA